MAISKNEGEAPIEFGKRLMDLVDEAALKGQKALPVYHTTVSPGEAIISPMGSFIAERTIPVVSGEKGGPGKDKDSLVVKKYLKNKDNKNNKKNDSLVVGLRMHFLEGKDTPGKKSFNQLLLHQNDLKLEEDRTLKFWQAVEDSYEKKKPLISNLTACEKKTLKNTFAIYIHMSFFCFQ